MRIVICDDNLPFAQRAAALISQFACEPMQIDILTDTGLLAELAKGILADLYFLDIEMPAAGGMALAQEIRRQSAKVIILFLTAYDQYVFQSFQVNALRYLRKSCFEQEIEEALCAAFRQFHEQKVSHIFKTPNGEIKIARGDIGYIQKVKRELYLYKTDGGSVRILGTVTQLAMELRKFRFVQPNSGCIANPAYIAGLLDATVIFENEARTPVSRMRRKELRRAIDAYWKEAL